MLSSGASHAICYRCSKSNRKKPSFDPKKSYGTVFTVGGSDATAVANCPP